MKIATIKKVGILSTFTAIEKFIATGEILSHTFL
jgi:hypothetical protein